MSYANGIFGAKVYHNKHFLIDDILAIEHISNNINPYNNIDFDFSTIYFIQSSTVKK